MAHSAGGWLSGEHLWPFRKQKYHSETPSLGKTDSKAYVFRKHLLGSLVVDSSHGPFPKWMCQGIQLALHTSVKWIPVDSSFFPSYRKAQITGALMFLLILKRGNTVKKPLLKKKERTLTTNVLISPKYCNKFRITSIFFNSLKPWETLQQKYTFL